MEVEDGRCPQLEFLSWREFLRTWKHWECSLGNVVQDFNECLTIALEDESILSFLCLVSSPIVSVRRDFDCRKTLFLPESCRDRCRNPTKDDSLQRDQNPKESFVVEEVHSLPENRERDGGRNDSGREWPWEDLWHIERVDSKTFEDLHEEFVLPSTTTMRGQCLEMEFVKREERIFLSLTNENWSRQLIRRSRQFNERFGLNWNCVPTVRHRKIEEKLN